MDSRPFSARWTCSTHDRGDERDGDDRGDQITSPAVFRSAQGTLPNNEGNLAGWILDPQHFKPDNKMPATALTGSELQPLLAYLESLH